MRSQEPGRQGEGQERGYAEVRVLRDREGFGQLSKGSRSLGRRTEPSGERKSGRRGGVVDGLGKGRTMQPGSGARAVREGES